ncbi:hypothetical protein NDA15_005430 [Ustilago hordei]|nr:hypothetical protein NDA15_005430 [Ustilago hordei]
MPPVTRAGQTRRDERDDDQVAAAAGNGQEEGWLMQVVRILQLANPALMAEEAIVWAMGLVTISNQTPRGETKKIPKDVSSSIAHIKKLSNSNWHTWEPTFINCLQRVCNVKEILYGKIAPGSKGYDEDLDKALVGLIHASCNHSPESCTDTYTVRGADEHVQLGSTLYAKLKKVLMLNDVDLKKSTLYCCTAQDWFYTNSVDALKTAKPDLQGLIKNGAWVTFNEFGTIIRQNDSTQIQYKRNRRKGQFEMQGKALALELEETLNDIPEDNQNTGKLDNAPEGNKDTKHRDSHLWHERFGHPG